MNIITSVGYGDMYPTTNVERFATMAVILVGDCCFALVFGMLTS